MNARSGDSEDPVPFRHLRTQRPVLLLDIDGVLNPLSHDRPDGWGDFQSARIGQYSMWLSESMGQALRDLDATVLWCSTWCDDPHELVEIARHLGGLCPLWFGRWGQEFDWKTDMVRAALTTFPLVVWIDDDEPVPSGMGTDRLIRITPSATKGLQPADIVQINDRLYSPA